MTLDFTLMEDLINMTGQLLESIINVILMFFNSFLPLFMFLFILGLVYAGFKLFDLRTYIGDRGKNNVRKR